MTTSAHAGPAALGRAAAGYVENGMKVGLGTGRAAAEFVRALGARVRDERLSIVGVPTSEATRALAEKLDLPLITLAEAGVLDLTVDGADEVDPRLDLVKGLGGALVREKIVAASSRRLVIVVGAEKLVERLGVRTPVPVEVVPFGLSLCVRAVLALGAQPALRGGASTPFVSDNGNYVLDCRFPGIDDAESLDRALRDIPGVVGTGLFAGMAEQVLVQQGGEVRVLERGLGSP
ncbi:MAG: ribose-5-phosphate isomerase RpiA [Deltaproteobacteria bacterium]|nr:ribose-5-phosphate isomerase RpiA [Deltaproteobacteria bacterium]